MNFESVALLVQEKKFKIDFQDGHHLGFPIGMIWAIFDLQVTPMLPTKSFGSGEEAKNRFWRWPPSWIGTILAISDLQVTPMLPTKFRVNWPFGSGVEAKNRFSRWPPWISNGNNFSYFWSTSHLDASYQVSSPLAQGCRRSRLLKQFLMTDNACRTTDIDWSQQLTLSTSCSGELIIKVTLYNSLNS